MSCPFDAAIARGSYPPAPGPDVQPPPLGTSFYWDARALGFGHVGAAQVAACAMASPLPASFGFAP